MVVGPGVRTPLSISPKPRRGVEETRTVILELDARRRKPTNAAAVSAASNAGTRKLAPVATSSARGTRETARFGDRPTASYRAQATIPPKKTTNPMTLMPVAIAPKTGSRKLQKPSLSSCCVAPAVFGSAVMTQR